MKNILLTLSALSVVLVANAATGKIDMMVEQIKAPREGVELKELSSTLNPFVSIELKENNATVTFAPVKKTVVFTLGAIMNERAYINNKWHKQGDMVSDYNLTHIGKRGVVLVGNKQVKKLFLDSKKSDAIKMKEGK